MVCDACDDDACDDDDDDDDVLVEVGALRHPITIADKTARRALTPPLTPPLKE